MAEKIKLTSHERIVLYSQVIGHIKEIFGLESYSDAEILRLLDKTGSDRGVLNDKLLEKINRSGLRNLAFFTYSARRDTLSPMLDLIHLPDIETFQGLVRKGELTYHDMARDEAEMLHRELMPEIGSGDVPRNVENAFVLEGITHLSKRDFETLKGVFLVHGIEELSSYNNHQPDDYEFYRSILKLDYQNSELIFDTHAKSTSNDSEFPRAPFQLGRIEGYTDAYFGCITYLTREEGTPFYLFGFLDIKPVVSWNSMPFAATSEMKGIHDFFPYAGYAILTRLRESEKNYDELTSTPLRNQTETQLLEGIVLGDDLKAELQLVLETLRKRGSPIILPGRFGKT